MKSSVSFNLYDQIITQAKTRKNIHVFKWYNQLHVLSYLEDLLHLTYVLLTEYPQYSTKCIKNYNIQIKLLP